MNERSYIRDSHSNAIINTNVNELKQYKLKKQEQNKVKLLEEKVDDLTNLVNRLIEKIDGN